MDPNQNSTPILNTDPTPYKQEVASNLGNIPFIYYGSYQIDVQNISTFRLYYKGGMPYLSISFYDTLNLMKDKGMPLDDSKIKVFINPKSDQLKEILIQFKIINFSVDGGVYNISGVLDVSPLLVSQYSSYSNMTSYEALQKICKECGLGFNTNIDNTDDAMTWINCGNYVYDFIDEIVEAAYKSDSSFLTYFIDYYYNLNYVDIAKELDRNIDDQLGVTDKSLGEAMKTISTESVQSLLLTNDYSMFDNNNYFQAYKIINNSTNISLQSGYKNTVKYYDELKKDFLVFDVHSITDKNQDKIILKSQPQDDGFYDLNTNYYYLGKFDSDNCHNNYNFATIQNDKNLFDMQKIVLEITMRNPNYAVYRYQKIKVFVSNQTSTPSSDLINNRLTGDWLIVDISFEYSERRYVQKIKLIKRELELSPDELENEPPINHPDLPNTVTNTDQVMLVERSNPPIPGTSSVTSVATAPPDNFILSKQIWRLIYNGKINPKVIELMYESMVALLKRYQMDTPVRIVTFLSQVNIESNFLQEVEEITSGIQYNNRADLGNVDGDGPKYIGRGLIKILGKNKYTTAGQLMNKDFVNNPNLVAADNKTHILGSDTVEQLNNCIEVSLIYYLKLSTWGNLNDYADKMDINQSTTYGLYTVPNKDSSAAELGYGYKLDDNFSKTINNNNLSNFTPICLAINGYNGYKDKINNWNEMRKYFI